MGKARARAGGVVPTICELVGKRVRWLLRGGGQRRAAAVPLLLRMSVT